MKKRLKIGLFIDTFYPMIDGVIVVVDNYASRLQKIADVTVFCPKSKKLKKEIERPYKIIRLESISLPSFDYDIPLSLLDIELLKIMRNYQFDLIHIHSPFTIGRIGVEYAKRMGVPSFGTFHSQYYQDFMKYTKSKVVSNLLLKNIMNIYNQCDRCYAVNSKIQDVYHEYGGKKPIKVMNNGTDMVLFQDEEMIQNLKNQYHITNEKVFLFVGRLVTQKNIIFIEEACKYLKERNYPFRMLFIGSGQDQSLLEEAIRKDHLEEVCILVGRVESREKLASYYRLADLFLFPSLYDASSLVQIEAASQKTPSLFIKGAVTADTITENINGYLAINDPFEYAKKIMAIFENKEQYLNICENAFRDQFVTWDEQVQKTYMDYENSILATHS